MFTFFLILYCWMLFSNCYMVHASFELFVSIIALKIL